MCRGKDQQGIERVSSKDHKSISNYEIRITLKLKLKKTPFKVMPFFNTIFFVAYFPAEN